MGSSLVPAVAALLLFCLATQVSCQRVGPVGFGRCPDMSEMKKFNIEKFKGKWYEVERSFYLLEIASSCTELSFVPQAVGDMVVTVKTINRWTGNPSVSFGKAVPLHGGSATLRYKADTRLPAALARALPGAGNYVILDTDYDNYAILWSCSNMGFMHTDLLWVLARERELPISSRAAVYEKLHQANLDSDRLTISKNENCPLF